MSDANWVYSDNVAVFERLSHKLASLVYSRTDGDKKLLEEILRDLNLLDFNSVCLKSNERGVLVVNQCCYLITPEDEQLVIRACEFFINLITKQQVSVTGKTLSLAVSWCLQCLQYKTDVAVLKCLQVLLRGNNKQVELQLTTVLDNLKCISNNFKIALLEPQNLEILLHCLKCVESVVTPSEGDPPVQIINDCFKIFTKILLNGKNEKNTHIVHRKCLITSMKGIGNLLELSDHIRSTHMNEILGIVKGYMLFGLPGDDCYRIEKVLPCQVAVPDVFKNSSDTRKLKGKYDKKAKKIPVTSITTVEENVPGKNDYVGYNDRNVSPDVPNFGSCRTSDSDYSEEEIDQTSKLRLQDSKVRQCALILLGIIVKKTDPKLFTGYLPNFLPDGSQIPHVRTLITCLLKDSFPSCRAEVVGIMTMLVSNSKQYFLQADNSSRTSFTTFSGTIGNIIRELHRSLALALIAENSVIVINRLLKCMSELIRCSPYRKLEPGLISRLSAHVKGFMSHRDANVQVSALTVFGCVVSVQPQTEEIREIFMKPFDHEENPGDRTANIKSWLFESCLKNIIGGGDDVTNAAPVIESLEVIGAMVRNFFEETVVNYPEDIIHVLQTCSKRPEYLVRLYGGKLIETVFNSLQFSLTLEDESKRAPIPLITQMWETLLPGPVTSLIQNDSEPMLRCTGCDCIANVGVLTHHNEQTSIQNSFIFDLLPTKLQILCITLLFGCVQDESPVVRSSAIRAVAILVLFPSLMEDPLFFLDAIDAAMETARDESNNVRYQSAWLLGNISELIVQNYEKKLGCDVTHKILLKLMETCLKLSEDNPKIRPGALRAIGNILRTVDEEYAANHKTSVTDGLNALVKNATSGSLMKARWNSCYAIANAFKNILVYKNAELVTKMFSCLTNLVRNYKNFKVRISAACALRAPPTRDNYGDHYISVWSSVLNALENSKNVHDINEYQHRDQLVDQLCLVILHLIDVISVDDLVPAEDLLVHHLDNVKLTMARFQESIVPEKGDVLLKATARIHNLMDLRSLRAEHRSAIAMFENLLDSGC